MASNVIRLNHDVINMLEQGRNLLIDMYSRIYANAPDEVKNCEVDRWKNASYSDLVDRLVYNAVYFMSK